MLVSRFIPLVVMAGIGVHSGPAIKDRMGGALTARDKLVTKQRMVAITEAVTLKAASGDDIELNSPDQFRKFVKRAVRIKGSSTADSSLDYWGVPFRHKMQSGVLTIISAGPDKKFGGSDDITQSANVFDF